MSQEIIISCTDDLVQLIKSSIESALTIRDSMIKANAREYALEWKGAALSYTNFLDALESGKIRVEPKEKIDVASSCSEEERQGDD